MGSDFKLQALRDLRNLEKPYIILIQETKMQEKELKNLKHRCWKYGKVEVVN